VASWVNFDCSLLNYQFLLTIQLWLGTLLPFLLSSLAPLFLLNFRVYEIMAINIAINIVA
jgi:hypothetical protein